MPRPRRFFPPEYKAEVVELIRTTGKTVGQVARELDLTETAIREWVKRADLDAGRRSDGLTTTEREELRRLRREVRDLREEREILRKAAVFFASMSRLLRSPLPHFHPHRDTDRRSNWAVGRRPLSQHRGVSIGGF